MRLTRKEIEANAWKALRYSQSELAAAIADLLAAVESADIIDSWQEPGGATDTVELAARVFTSRVHGMAANTETNFAGGLR